MFRISLFTMGILPWIPLAFALLVARGSSALAEKATTAPHTEALAPRKVSSLPRSGISVTEAQCREERARKAPGMSGAENPGRRWVLSGYLPEDTKPGKPDRKVWVTLKGKEIESISAHKPQTTYPILETDDFIFPGLVDIHNHLRYDTLPLWSKARGQFKNRFEWRMSYKPYDSVYFNLRPQWDAPSSHDCAVTKWGKLKSLLGGATTTQGAFPDLDCSDGFGNHNVESPQEFSSHRPLGNFVDLVMPGTLNYVDRELLRNTSGRQMANWTPRDYEEAEENDPNLKKAAQWAHAYLTMPRTLSNGLRLLLGDEKMAQYEIQDASEKPGSTLDWLNGLRFLNRQNNEEVSLAQLLKSSFLTAAPAEEISREVNRMSAWLEQYRRAEPKEANAYAALAGCGVLSLPDSVRYFAGAFELNTRRRAQGILNANDGGVVLAHLAEGQHADPYNSSEFSYAHLFGLDRKGLVVIHGVGLRDVDLEIAAAKGVSMVWSPFSNLLMYGETLDVAKAKRKGINVSLAPDWSPSGGKNLLDELKVARRYMDLYISPSERLSDEDLVEMVTVNPAKAVRLGNRIGKVRPGYQADLLLVRRTHSNPFTSLVQARQQDLDLVVVSGDPIYGDKNAIGYLGCKAGDSEEPEALPRNLSSKPGCSEFQANPKAIRLASSASVRNRPYPKTDLRRVSDLEATLNGRIAQFRKKVESGEVAGDPKDVLELDSLFDCESGTGPDDYASRLQNFLPNEYENNLRNRASLRKKEGLSDSFNPRNIVPRLCY